MRLEQEEEAADRDKEEEEEEEQEEAAGRYGSGNLARRAAYLTCGRRRQESRSRALFFPRPAGC
jgi:hypothetical protein